MSKTLSGNQLLGSLPALEVFSPGRDRPRNAEITSPQTLKSRTMVSIPPKRLGPSTEDPLEIDVDPGARRDGEKTNLHRPADLKAAPVTRAIGSQEKKHVKDPVEIHNIKQKDGETIEEFMERFKVETGRMKGAPECMKISRLQAWSQ
ncbi:hypothetical protein Tco_0677885 [Tanacetum coccineum]|uniref:Reverse transcriptase domain-containing protein n=1 Tax=Tanacetum coccineum TaxID=301880 RepID=A0ABQ4XDQ6_9ASTR